MPDLPLWRPADLFRAARPAPEPLCLDNGIDTILEPPGLLVTRIMERPMVDGAERNGRLIARLAAERACLREADVMRLGWRPAANQARLRGDEAKVILVANAAGSFDGEPRSGGLGRSPSNVPLARWLRGILGQVGEAQPIELAEDIDMVLPTLRSEIGESVA